MQVDCTVRNLSEGGAKLEISGAVTLPDEFDLVIPPEEPASARAPVLAPGRCLWRAFSRAVRGRERICGLIPAGRRRKSGCVREFRQLERTITQLNARIEQFDLRLIGFAGPVASDARCPGQSPGFIVSTLSIDRARTPQLWRGALRRPGPRRISWRISWHISRRVLGHDDAQAARRLRICPGFASVPRRFLPEECLRSRR